MRKHALYVNLLNVASLQSTVQWGEGVSLFDTTWFNFK